MRAGLIVSVLGHLALLAWGLLTLPGARPLDMSQLEAVPVEFISVTEETTVVKGSQTAEVIDLPAPNDPAPPTPEPPTPAPPSPQPKPEPTPPPPPPPPPPPEPTPPVPEPPAPEPIPIPEPPQPEPPPPEPTPAPQPEAAPPPPAPSTEAEPPPPQETAALPKPPPPKPRIRPTPPKPAPVKPVEQAQKPAPEQPKTDESFNTDDIAALLDKSEPTGSTEASDRPASAGARTTTNPNVAMSVNELDALRAQLVQCWNPPIGWTDPAEIRVVVQMALNADGSLNGDPQVLEAPAGRYTQTAPESVVRAIRRCAPYNLPAEKYDAWQEIKITFDPKDMLGG